MNSYDAEKAKALIGWVFLTSVFFGLLVNYHLAFGGGPLTKTESTGEGEISFKWPVDEFAKLLQNLGVENTALVPPLWATALTTCVLGVPSIFYLLDAAVRGWKQATIRHPDAADSFYYIGFVLTLTGLFFGALNLSSGAAKQEFDIGRVFLQNIVALFSTIVGLTIRNALQYFLPEIVTSREEQAISGIRRAGEAVDDLNEVMIAFSLEFRKISQTMTERLTVWGQADSDARRVQSSIKQLGDLLARLETSQARMRNVIENSTIRADQSLKSTLASVDSIVRTSASLAEEARETLKSVEQTAQIEPTEPRYETSATDRSSMNYEYLDSDLRVITGGGILGPYTVEELAEMKKSVDALFEGRKHSKLRF